MDFELKKLLHDEMGMVRIDLSDKIDEFWLSKISVRLKNKVQHVIKPFNESSAFKIITF